MQYIRRCAYGLPALALAMTVSANNLIQLDLAAPVASQPVEAGLALDVRLTNRLPGKQYKVVVRRRDVPVPPLQAPVARAALDCTNLRDSLVPMLTSVTREQDVVAVTNQFRQLAASCDLTVVDEAIAAVTGFGVGTYTLLKGQELVVEVTRDDRKWEFTLTTGARGEWRTFYGFLFVPNRDENHFSSQSTIDPASFIITRESDRQKLDFAPSMLFVWSPATAGNRSLSHGLTGGVGFDMDNPIVFGGYALTFNENLALTAGVTLHKRRFLAGRYQPGEVIGTSLSREQLSESTYDANAYVGIAFRFGSNPFARSGE